MTRLRRPAAFFSLLLACLCILAAPGMAQSRIALVVGNGGYRFGPLPNAVNDARLVSGSLKQAGFAVTTVLDADRRAFGEAVRAFAAQAKAAGPDAVAAFYYAGHAVQIAGRNFLIPVEAGIRSASDVEYETVEAQWVLDLIGESGAPLSIIMLDACRTNPFPAASRAVDRGLARMDAPRGALLSYSTAPGQVAYDGQGDNSPYASALSQAMLKPGLKIEDVFKQVRRAVLAETGDKQTPWESSSLLGDFFFTGGAATQPAAYAPALGNPAPDGQAAFRDCADCPQMIRIPGGAFRIGSPATERGRQPIEGPEAQVSIRAFALARTEVTLGEFRRFTRETGYAPHGGCWRFWAIWIWDPALSWESPGYAQGDDHPVACVSYPDAQAYAAWMSSRAGARYRLPSEAEFEWAMGGDGPAPWGDWGFSPAVCAHANVHDESAYRAYGNAAWARSPCDDGHAFTAPVGAYADGPYGLKDMLGNLMEWTEDCDNPGHAGARADGGPMVSGDCARRVQKGAAWASAADWDRPAFRYGALARDGNIYAGFRLARDL